MIIEKLENLQRGYNTFCEQYKKLIDTKSTDIYVWLTLINNVSILCFRAKDFDLFYDVQNLKHKIMNKMNDIYVAK